MRRMRLVALAGAAVLATWALGAGTASAHFPTCEESVNPHGQNTPPAGSTTLPGPRGGQNEDGFYKIGSDAGSDVFVVTGGVTFGPFSSGTVVKYTQAPGATPSSKTIGSDNGQAGAVTTHITGPDELVVRSIDGSTITCFVPPPPK
jgi:hypothetical protein